MNSNFDSTKTASRRRIKTVFVPMTEAIDRILGGLPRACEQLYKELYRLAKWTGVTTEIDLAAIAQAIGYAFDTVRRAFHKLINVGLIACIHRFNGREYKIQILHPDVENTSSTAATAPAQPEGSSTRENTPPAGDFSPPLATQIPDQGDKNPQKQGSSPDSARIEALDLKEEFKEFKDQDLKQQTAPQLLAYILALLQRLGGSEDPPQASSIDVPSTVTSSATIAGNAAIASPDEPEPPNPAREDKAPVIAPSATLAPTEIPSPNPSLNPVSRNGDPAPVPNASVSGGNIASANILGTNPVNAERSGANTLTPNPSDLLDQVRAVLGTLNPQLKQLVLNSQTQVVLNALEVVKAKQAKATPDKPIRSVAGLFVAAVREGWTVPEKKESNGLPEGFKPWFDQAQRANWVTVSLRRADGQIWVSGGKLGEAWMVWTEARDYLAQFANPAPEPESEKPTAFDRVVYRLKIALCCTGRNRERWLKDAREAADRLNIDFAEAYNFAMA